MRFSFFLVLLSSCFLLHAEEPWGKDSDLLNPLNNHASRSFFTFSSGFETIIQFHQKILTNADGPRSHFMPKSSQYMKDAIRLYGLLKGFSMGCDRLLRENNEIWVYSLIRTKDNDIMKYDPVPYP